MLLVGGISGVQAGDNPGAIELVPTVNTVQGNVIWLMKEAAIAEGPAYDIAKLYKLVSLQGQIATINKKDAGTFFGLTGTVKITDIVTKLGGDPGNMLITFNPGVGGTFGFKTTGKKLDGGIVVNVVNLDLDKLMKNLGL